MWPSAARSSGRNRAAPLSLALIAGFSYIVIWIIYGVFIYINLHNRVRTFCTLKFVETNTVWARMQNVTPNPLSVEDPLPLARHENLYLFNRSQPSFFEMSTSLSPSQPSRTDHKPLEERHNLGTYKIFVDRRRKTNQSQISYWDGNPLPESDFSVGARWIVLRRKTMLEQNEPGAIRLVEPFMLPTGEAEDKCGLPLISKKYDIHFAKTFLPPSPPVVQQKLQQTRPDMCLGYITSQISLSSTRPSQATSTINEELLIARCAQVKCRCSFY